MSATVTNPPPPSPNFTVPLSYPLFLQQTTPLRGISVQDPYAAATGTPITVTIGDLAGMLSLGDIAGLALTGFGTTQVTLSGSLDAVNAGLATLQYAEPAERLPFDTISFAVTDGGGGTNFAQIGIEAGPPVAPTITAPTALAASDGAAVAIAGLMVSDPTGTETLVSVTLTDQSGVLAAAAADGGAVSGSGSGALTLAGTFAAVNQELAGVTYAGAGSAATDTIAISAADLAGTAGPVEIAVTVGGVPPGGVGGTGGTGGTTTIAPGPGNNFIPLDGGNSVVFSTGTDIIFGGSGPATVFATGNALLFGGSGSLVFINGAGTSIVVGGAGSETIDGGAGGGMFKGGSDGNNVIIAGQQATTIWGGGNGDLLFAAGSAADLLIAGTGNETLVGVGSTGDNVFYAGPGNDLLGGGAGNETFIGGTGSETVIGGSGADLYAFINGLSSGGNDVIFGFDAAKGDRVLLDGYGANPVASQSSGGGSTTLVLTDNTTITFEGVANLPNSAFV